MIDNELIKLKNHLFKYIDYAFRNHRLNELERDKYELEYTIQLGQQSSILRNYFNICNQKLNCPLLNELNVNHTNKEYFAIALNLINNEIPEKLNHEKKISNNVNINNDYENIELSNNLDFFYGILDCIKNYFESYIKQFLPELIKEFSIIETNQQQTKKGFQSNLSDKQIESLFNQLINGNYIDKNTNENHFKAIFKNENLPNDFIPIKKTKSCTVVLLAYFVSELFQKNNPNDYWYIAENCFDVKNLKQSLNNAYQFNPDRKPRRYKSIDTILKNLYTPLQ